MAATDPSADGAAAGLPADTAERLLSISAALSRERDLDRLLDVILRAARELTGAEAGRLYTLDEPKRNLVLRVAQNTRLTRAREAETSVPLFPGGRRNTAHIAGHCAFSGQRVVLSDLYRAPGFDLNPFARYDQLNGYRTASLLALPLHDHEGLTIGVLMVINAADGAGRRVAFDEGRQRVIAAFAAQAAVAINTTRLIAENARLIEMLNASNRALRRENQLLRSRIRERASFDEIIGGGARMRRVFDLMGKIVRTQATVLVTGETGTGKELIARALHYNGPRAHAAFVTQNCAALPESLLESELFGYRKGAFTGATTDKKGLFEAADGGTLFLDEIGDMPLGLQAKLLRVLQEGEVRPLGATTGRRVDVRLIAATHCDLADAIRTGTFREDLYYRLCVFPIALPPLRERRDDLPELVEHFLADCCKRHGKTVAGIAPETLELLAAYDFPGNIRELRNLIERGVLMAEDHSSLLPEDLPAAVHEAGERTFLRPDSGPEGAALRDRMAAFEARTVQRALDAAGWNQTRAAEMLQISRRGLIEKMQRHGLRRPEPAGEGDA